MNLSDGINKKTYLITGGRTGIGRKIVDILLRHDVKIIILGRNIKRLKKAFNNKKLMNYKIFMYECDITDLDKCKAVIDHIYKTHGRVDTLINNAGMNFMIRAETLLPNMLEKSIRTNLIAPFYLSILLAKRMIKQSGIKKIINISAFTGEKSYPGLAHSHCGKAGLNALTRTLAIEWSNHNILVNSIGSGEVLTNRFRKIITRLENYNTRSIIDDYRRTELPFGKFISKQDIANMVMFLCSSHSNSITGQVLCVDGGAGINNSFLLKHIRDSRRKKKR